MGCEANNSAQPITNQTEKTRGRMKNKGNRNENDRASTSYKQKKTPGTHFTGKRRNAK